MTPDQALAFVRRRGVVLASGKSALPSIAECVAGGPIKGSWWAHSKGREIFRALQALESSTEILFCRLVEGKITLVHRRLWPALVRVAPLFATEQLTQIHQEHTARGHHVNKETAFPNWVPPDVMRQAQSLSEGEALEALRSCGVAAQPERRLT
jgi:hypothetical protein